MGADIIVDRLIWVEETFWKSDKQRSHTICHYHLISLKDQSQIPCEGTFKSLESDVSRLIFQWVNLEQIQDLNNITIYPLFLKEKIINISDGIEHFICRE
jgi:hypothetical protein